MLRKLLVGATEHEVRIHGEGIRPIILKSVKNDVDEIISVEGLENIAITLEATGRTFHPFRDPAAQKSFLANVQTAYGQEFAVEIQVDDEP
jgi:hypothetical protein